MSDLAADLPSMSQDQLREIVARATALLKPADRNRTDEQDLYSALTTELTSQGISLPHYAIAMKSPAGPTFLRGASVVSSFVAEHIEPTTKAHRILAYRRFMKMLARWMVTCGIPVTLKNVAQNLDKVPAIVQRQFPGYLESGLLPMVLRAAPADPGVWM